MDLEYGYDADKCTFFILVDKTHKAIVTYTDYNGVWHLEHTIVPSELSGKGIGGKLAKYVFDYLSEYKIKYKSVCSFLIAYEQKNNLI